ncbi:MAG: hypothetical protein JNL74_06635, partial [Fibrobacteres bacterium]|nr:hypothetical protein [Fibrobacterota bacterium]
MKSIQFFLILNDVSTLQFHVNSMEKLNSGIYKISVAKSELTNLLLAGSPFYLQTGIDKNIKGEILNTVENCD